ncbi:MAG TPA: BlaI/MecI/CopY family transcriptional regulator [Bryobacteraceae bacterium]|nr:BlaI/MecI/CopY family transcriptional regulator [Bryobacteraceae bacterium]
MKPKNISDLEHVVMEFVWTHGPCTAEACREGLAGKHPLKDSTVRTLLRRLEAKGYVQHEVDGRTFLYRSLQAPQTVAARAVKQIIDKLCGGSVEQLLVGMVDHDVLNRKQLQRLAQKIAARKGESI